MSLYSFTQPTKYLCIYNSGSWISMFSSDTRFYRIKEKKEKKKLIKIKQCQFKNTKLDN